MNKSLKHGSHLLPILLISALAGCASTTSSTHSVATQVSLGRDYGHQPSGVVEYVWEEPMVDVVDVPPGLDPEGIYYRPAHQEVLEVRQGRWKYYREP